jgi:cytochrome c
MVKPATLATLATLAIVFSLVSAIAITDADSAHTAATNSTDRSKSNNHAEAIQSKFGALKLKFPEMDPMKGKKLFVDRGCVACHAVNGIGGHDAPALDAHKMGDIMNPFEFAAKMWKGAPAMIAAQEGAFDAQLLFSGDDLANIIAFAHSDSVQHGFTESDLTDKARKMMNHSHGKANGGSHHSEEKGHGKDHHDGENAKPHAHQPN